MSKSEETMGIRMEKWCDGIYVVVPGVGAYRVQRLEPAEFNVALRAAIDDLERAAETSLERSVDWLAQQVAELREART